MAMIPGCKPIRDGTGQIASTCQGSEQSGLFCPERERWEESITKQGEERSLKINTINFTAKKMLLDVTDEEE